MDWIPLLASVVRLIDLHDSQRALGNLPDYSQEVRPGNRDGVYLDIAFAVLECLQTLEQAATDDYMPLTRIVRFVAERCPEVAEVDVQFVLNVLRRPTEVWYLGEENLERQRALCSEKSTALVEKTAYADEFRLSRSGRTAIALASAYKSVAYMESDALRLLRAVEGGDFHLLAAFASDLIQQLRREILEIRDVQEKVGKAGTVERYIANFTRYRTVIDNTIATIKKTEQTLDKSDTFERFTRWQDDSDSNASMTYDQLRNHVHRVRQVLEVFNRALTEVVALSLKSYKSAVPPPEFLEFALRCVYSPLQESQLDTLIRQWCAVGFSSACLSVLDVKGAVKQKTKSPSRDAVVFGEEQLEPVSRVGNVEFLDRYGGAIAKALETAPLSLSDAIARGWFVVDETLTLGDLVGLFIAPDTLPIEGNICISLSSELQSSDLKCAEFLYNELKLSILGEPVITP